MADKFYAEMQRKYYITPKSYLDCVNLYITLLNEKRLESISAQDRFLNGLNKLKETNELIATMKVCSSTLCLLSKYKLIEFVLLDKLNSRIVM